MYSDNQKTMEYEDDIKAILKCILCCYKVNTLTSQLLNHLLHEMGLLTLHNYCVSCSLKYYNKWSQKVDFLFQSFLVITVGFQINVCMQLIPCHVSFSRFSNSSHSILFLILIQFSHSIVLFPFYYLSPFFPPPPILFSFPILIFSSHYIFFPHLNLTFPFHCPLHILFSLSIIISSYHSNLLFSF